MAKQLQIGVIIASTRPVRMGKQVADWVKQITDKDAEAHYTFLDLADIELPFLAEPKLPAQGDYQQESTKAWAAKIGAQDGFLVVTPEYNHGYPATLKNAIDTLYAEWVRKPVAYVGYGSLGAARSIEQLNNVFLQLEAHPIVKYATNILLFEHLDDSGTFAATERHESSLDANLVALKEWATLLKQFRSL